jgi:hypothetical protein
VFVLGGRTVPLKLIRTEDDPGGVVFVRESATQAQYLFTNDLRKSLMAKREL